MRFKSQCVQDEFGRAHPTVQALALYADWWVKANIKHDLLLTDVARTQEEYDSIYAGKIEAGMCFIGLDGIKHYAGPRPHLETAERGSHAVDIRQPGELTMLEAEQLRDHFNLIWPRKDGKPTSLIHDVGRGVHFHLQSEV